jgi:glutamine amidotransferase
MQAIIVDYGMGNIASVQKALDLIGIDNIISKSNSDFEESDFIILPGVGSFKQGMENLNKFGLVNILNNEVCLKKKPFLGICLGMQLIADLGTENGSTKGLSWIDGKVIQIKDENKRIPHLGWNNINTFGDSFIKEFNGKDFYFIHSYHFEVKDHQNIAAKVNYGADYVAAIHSGNIFATQFHPEKSQTEGIKLIKKFIDFYA